MTRYLYSGISEQRRASDRRQADAYALYEKERWRGAMYMMGYAVECRLKSLLMEKFQATTLDQLEEALRRRLKRDVDVRDHSIERLFDLLEIRDKLLAKDRNTENLRAFNRCNRWNVSWRYRPDEGNEEDCRVFFDAVKRFLRFIMHNA